MDNVLGAALEHEHHDIDAGIEAYSRGSAATPDRVASLTRAVAALRRHIYLEEEFLFPPLRPLLAVPTIVMLREHGELWRILDGLEVQLRLSPDESVLQTCDELLALLDRHNSKEEPIFYTQADSGLTPAARDELTSFLESGQMPEGWVCQTAQG